MDDHRDNPQGRRREQVRKAQKTHRTRKALYVKSLETEVGELRKQKAADLEVIRQLQALLLANGISIPQELVRSNSSGGLTTIHMVGDKRAQQAVQARLPSVDTVSQAREHSNGSASRSSSSHRAETVGQPSAHNQGLDSTQVAIDFILALEQPCLHHHRLPSPELLMTGTMGNGHQAMLSSPIMSRSPAYSLNPFKVGYTSGASWTVPTAELEALLQTSNKLPLTSEVTPVQIWQLVKSNPKFNDITFEHLEEFRQALLPMVKCYGFGAVIDQVLLEAALHNLFEAI